MNTLLLAHLAMFFGGMASASDDGEPGPGFEGQLKVADKGVAAHRLLEHTGETHAYDVALAMRDPAEEYQSVVEELQGAVKRSLKNNALVSRVRILEPFTDEVEPSEVADTIKEHRVRYLVLLSLHPPKHGDVPVLRLELWNAKGEVKDRMEVTDALDWKQADVAAGAPETHEAPGDFDTDAWRLTYQRYTTWTYTRGGYMPSFTSVAVVVDADDNVLDDREILAAASPEVTKKGAASNRAAIASLVFQIATVAAVLAFPPCLACVGAVGGTGVGGVYALGGAPILLPLGLLTGLVGGFLAGCGVSTFAWFATGVVQAILNGVAYYFRKAFYISAINEHNQGLSSESDVDLEGRPREYHPSSLFWD